MSDEDLDKQHQASGKRIAELRKQGQSLRSRDLTSGLIFIVTVIMLLIMSTEFVDRLGHNFVWSFDHIKDVIYDNDFPGDFVGKLATDNFFLLIPLFIACMIAALSSPFIFGGWNFSLGSIRFKPEKFDLVKNIINIFSKRILTEIMKSMIKITVLMGILFYFCYAKKEDILNIVNMPLRTAIKDAASIIQEFIIVIAVSLIFIILFDVVYSFFEYQKRNKMSTQEIKDEHKESEGSAEVKKKLRSNQLALYKQRLGLTVPKAHVIITNPTHYAIALRYDENKDKAPKVVAKGKDFLAQQIKTIGIANSVPIYPAPELARAIYHTAKVNNEIHPGLYMAVAIVLSYIHQLRNYQHGHGQMPQRADDLSIPKELIFDK